MTDSISPKRARITAWNDLEQFGRVTADDGEEFRLGGNACSDFAPKLDEVCWIVEVRSERVAAMRRAVRVNKTGAHEPTDADRAAAAKRRLEAERAEPIVPVFVPPLIDTLRLIEQQRGAALSPMEVEAIRDEAPCIMLRVSEAQKLEIQRGYADLDPERVWPEWVARRELP